MHSRVEWLSLFGSVMKRHKWLGYILGTRMGIQAQRKDRVWWEEYLMWGRTSGRQLPIFLSEKVVKCGLKDNWGTERDWSELKYHKAYMWICFTYHSLCQNNKVRSTELNETLRTFTRKKKKKCSRSTFPCCTHCPCRRAYKASKSLARRALAALLLTWMGRVWSYPYTLQRS